MHTRDAILPDVDQMHDLILRFSREGTLLPRSHAELCENVREFIVVEQQGQIVGCGALHFYGTHLIEIRSIAVLPEFQGRGVGRLLIDALLAEAGRHAVACVCLFTRIPDFFARFGFEVALRSDLPDKIYKDCINCPKLHACDEVAMVRGKPPIFAMSDQARVSLPLVKWPA